jgi:predicted dehydrogenase
MKTYVIIGTGGRSMMFTEAFIKYFKEHVKLLAISDINQGRLNLTARSLKPAFGDIPYYKAEDFDKMIKIHQPDCVIVTTIDRMHDEYICRSLEAGCDVITEKPMTIDEKKCQRIIDTVKKTGRKVRVTFNYRYSLPRDGRQVLFASSWSINCGSNCGSQSNPQDYVIDGYFNRNGMVSLADGVDFADERLADIL